MAKVCAPVSPYVYCASSPIIVRDSDGNVIETILDGVGIVADAVAVATPFVPGGVGAGIKAVRAGDKIDDVVKGVDKVTDATKTVDTGKVLPEVRNAAKTTTHSDDLKNVIYEVPGAATMDGKPYIGRTNDLSRRRHENRDGRDRNKATVIGHYDPNVPKSGAIQEQKAINERGLKNLSNKRNEIKQSDWDRYGIQQ